MTPPPVSRVDAAHAAVLAALHGDVFPHAAWNEAAFVTLLNQPGNLALIHEAGGFLLLRVVLDEAEILTFGTIQKRQGIGRALLHEGLIRLRQTNVEKLYLEVAARNEAAKCFYETFGFGLTGRRKAYYEDGDDALTMCLLCSKPGGIESDD